MNILIPHHWLLEHLETSAEPSDIQKHLSLSGPSVERIYEKSAPITGSNNLENVYDIEVTTNRVDSMSVRGVAREAAVILNQAKIPSSLKEIHISVPQQEAELPLPKINDPSGLCKRIMCVVIKDVARTATPDWMAERLVLTDQQVHDSVIDITNYITHELGHPVHAFDYDKVMAKGGVINVTLAEKGKKFITLDKQSYTTVGGEVVFENDDGEIIDLPAIKGTANTSIDDSTTNVLLWIENLPAEKVRFASMTHSIRTVAAQLSEKRVDPHLAEVVLLRGVALYQELCQATIASEIYDLFPAKKEETTLSVEASLFKRYLGIELSTETITHILTALECRVEYQEKSDTYQIVPPSFRPDLAIPVDIVEEIARIYGYHNLPSVLMDGTIPTKPQPGVNFTVENKIKHFLAAIGLQELYTYSTVSDIIARQSGYELNDHLKLQNPLSDDRVYLRRSLLPSLQEVLDSNQMRKDLSVFEIANVYIPKEKNIPDEHLHLSIVSKKSYREVRGIIEALLQQFFISNVSIVEQPESLGIQKQMGVIQTETDYRVHLGTISILESGAIGCTLSMKRLLEVVQSHPTYKKPANTAQIIEDLTFTISSSLIGDVIREIEKTSPLITSVTLKDVYKTNYTFTITYQDDQRNLTTEEIEPIRKEIVTTLADKHEASLVGTV